MGGGESNCADIPGFIIRTVINKGELVRSNRCNYDENYD